MESFKALYARAAKRKGGEQLLKQLLADLSHHPHTLTHLSDDRVLSAFSKKIFQSGFVWHP
ncbi:hypothetical protein AADZ91_07400 [Colwelliaceae bacterium 6441]